MKRIVQYLAEYGIEVVDPVGFLIASHRALMNEQQESKDEGRSNLPAGNEDARDRAAMVEGDRLQ